MTGTDLGIVLWKHLLRLALSALLLAPPVLSADGIPDDGASLDSGGSTRIKDITDIEGVRTNQLVGYGLVVGLNGTGDNTSNAQFTSQSIDSLLKQLGVQLPDGTRIKPKNVAAVMVSATLPPFVKQGQTIDVTVSSLGNAESLRGGTLLMTPLKGPDGQVYALAQGSLIVGGFGAHGSDGSKITVNVPSAGRIPNGAIVERTVASPFSTSSEITLNLHRPDFTTAKRLADAINNRIGKAVATPLDGASIKVRSPEDAGRRVAFMATIENVSIEPGDAPARVVINARTGTVVIGERVVVKPAAVSHGNLVVTITESPITSQPPPLSGGQTAVTPNSDIGVNQDSRMFLMQQGTTLEEIVNAVNQVGAAPGDLVAILEALREAGALRAELVVI